MATLFLILGIFAAVVCVLAIAGILISIFEEEYGALVVAVITAIAAGIFTAFCFVHYANEARTQCEEAGYEWIIDTCYGVNVNVN